MKRKKTLFMVKNAKATKSVQKKSEKGTKNNAYIFRDTDVRKYCDTKGKVPYLSWPFVVAKLKSVDPNASYSVKQFPEINLRTGKQTGRKVNYCEGVNGEGSYVTVTAKFKGQTYTESLPCYERVNETTVDANGQRKFVIKTNRYNGRKYYPKVLSTKPTPNVTVVNNAIKRCYVKAVAMLTGLGIDLYINPQNYLRNGNGGQHTTPKSKKSNYPSGQGRTPQRQQPKPQIKKITPRQVGELNNLIKETAKVTGASVNGQYGLTPYIATNYANSYNIGDMPVANFASAKTFLENHIMDAKNKSKSSNKAKSATK